MAGNSFPLSRFPFPDSVTPRTRRSCRTPLTAGAGSRGSDPRAASPPSKRSACPRISGAVWTCSRAGRGQNSPVASIQAGRHANAPAATAAAQLRAGAPTAPRPSAEPRASRVSAPARTPATETPARNGRRRAVPNAGPPATGNRPRETDLPNRSVFRTTGGRGNRNPSRGRPSTSRSADPSSRRGGGSKPAGPRTGIRDSPPRPSLDRAPR